MLVHAQGQQWPAQITNLNPIQHLTNALASAATEGNIEPVTAGFYNLCKNNMFLQRLSVT